MGRIAGLAMTDMTGELYMDKNWNWIDPGGFALIGAAAFFGGVSRLTISLTVIMMEITNDIRFLLPIMTAVLVSKLTADKLTHSLYHALLDVKCVPFLNSVAPPSDSSLDLLPVARIMSPTIDTIPLEVTSVSVLAKFLKKTKANAFPVVENVSSGSAARSLFRGVLLRKHLLYLIKHAGAEALRYEDLEDVDKEYVHKVSEHEECRIIEDAEAKGKESNNAAAPTIDIAPYIDVSAISVRQDCPTNRAFLVFRSLGLRHLVVVDKMNTPVGMLTRKDLIGMHIEHAVHMAEENPLHAHGHA
jgi:chloride channel 7